MTRTCPKCGQSNPPDAAFCRNCATALGLAAPSQQHSPPLAGQAPYAGAPPQGYVGAQNFAVQGNPQAPSSQRPLISVILAIVGLLCCGPLTGIPASIVAWLELDAIKNGTSSPNGKTMAQIGFWGGIAVTVIHGILWVLYLLFGMLASASSY
ncbi:MAG TPA: zinc ribbon domain-containing protein [Pyrinomonadaceae bacterium]|nr:zinc ribbon domain-containing protein [Pyrinomonadaceae bacterium]